jgi:hypothetical protein
MENKLLQPLLQAGLLDIGDSDERLANIEKSIADLQKKLDENRLLLPAYTLVALDPQIQDSEQVLVDTETIVTAHWKALRAKFPERPIPVLRAVMLNALYNLGIDDPYIARIIYLTASNYYPYAKLGREKEIVEGLITELGNIAEEDASKEWALSEEKPDLKIGALKITGLKFEDVSVDKTKLKASLKTAAEADPNTGHGPQHGNANWQNHFSEQSAKGISSAVNSALSEFAKSLSPTSIETPINKFFTDFKKSLDQTLKSSFESIIAVDRRSKLLWWKETLYSASLKNSYRMLDKSIQPLIMAYDLYKQLPEITPVSVDFLLRDTLLLLNHTAAEEITIAEYLKEINQGNNKTMLKEYFDDDDKGTGRISVTDFISVLVNDKLDISSFKQRTGIDEKSKVSLNDIAVIVLHDLLTQHLISD